MEPSCPRRRLKPEQRVALIAVATLGLSGTASYMIRRADRHLLAGVKSADTQGLSRHEDGQQLPLRGWKP